MTLLCRYREMVTLSRKSGNIASNTNMVQGEKEITLQSLILLKTEKVKHMGLH